MLRCQVIGLRQNLRVEAERVKMPSNWSTTSIDKILHKKYPTTTTDNEDGYSLQCKGGRGREGREGGEIFAMLFSKTARGKQLYFHLENKILFGRSEAQSIKCKRQLKMIAFNVLLIYPAILYTEKRVCKQNYK